jgi:hypothetical protein
METSTGSLIALSGKPEHDVHICTRPPAGWPFPRSLVAIELEQFTQHDLTEESRDAQQAV